MRENTEARGDYPWMTSNVLQSETQTPICFGSLGAKQGFSLKQTSAAHLFAHSNHSTSTAARTNYATDMPAFNQEAD